MKTSGCSVAIPAVPSQHLEAVQAPLGAAPANCKTATAVDGTLFKSLRRRFQCFLLVQKAAWSRSCWVRAAQCFRSHGPTFSFRPGLWRRLALHPSRREQIARLPVWWRLRWFFFSLFPKRRWVFPSLRSVTADKRNLQMIVETSPDPAVPVPEPRDPLASDAAPTQT